MRLLILVTTALGLLLTPLLSPVEAASAKIRAGSKADHAGLSKEIRTGSGAKETWASENLRSWPTMKLPAQAEFRPLGPMRRAVPRSAEGWFEKARGLGQRSHGRGRHGGGGTI
jgi:hypothetical protein